MQIGGDGESPETETFRGSRVGPAVRFVLLLGAIAAFWLLAYWCAGGGLLTGLALGAGGLRFTALFYAVIATTLVWLLFAGFILYELTFPHRLELGPDALRLTRAGPFGEVLKAHVPYRNVARVSGSRKRRANPFAILLHDPADPDTHLASEVDRHRVGIGLTYRLPGGWDADADVVAERLKRRCGHLLDPERSPGT